jgi:hypothetical protein
MRFWEIRKLFEENFIEIANFLQKNGERVGF